MTVLKVTPDEMAAICVELDQASSDTKCIIKRYNEILNKLNSVWTGEEQENFKYTVTEHLQYMEQLAEICDNYRMELSNVIRCYQEAENSLVNVIARYSN